MASGSGIVLSSDGYIATNNHVVEDGIEYYVDVFNKGLKTTPAKRKLHFRLEHKIICNYLNAKNNELKNENLNINSTCNNNIFTTGYGTDKGLQRHLNL